MPHKDIYTAGVGGGKNYLVSTLRPPINMARSSFLGSMERVLDRIDGCPGLVGFGSADAAGQYRQKVCPGPDN